MCTERDRLVDYIYNECDAAERERMQRHLDSCHECRAEVASLRAVREDLLAWDVPAHESIWRPIAQAPVLPFWRQVPVWAMAAAAGLVLFLGGTGGAVAHAFMPNLSAETTTASVSTPIADPARLASASLDLTPFERQVAEVTQQVGALNARVERASNRTQLVVGLEGDHNAMTQRIADLQNENQRLTETNQALRDQIKSIYLNAEGIRDEFDLKNAAVRQQVKELQALVFQMQAQVK